MEGWDAISLEVYNERELPNEGIPEKIKEKRLEQEQREREKSVHPCARTSFSGEIVKNHLHT